MKSKINNLNNIQRPVAVLTIKVHTDNTDDTDLNRSLTDKLL